MDKPLSKMTLEELWELFPIVLSEHKNCWPDWYEEEKQMIASLLPNQNIKISHIGSTAIQHIWAKPIIDILVELPEDVSMADALRLTRQCLVCAGEEDGKRAY